MKSLSLDALVVSAGEPQLERCLAAVRNQTVPFSNLVRRDNVIPEHLAFNGGMAEAVSDWVMKIDGDMILYENAVEEVLKYVEDHTDMTGNFVFPLNDTFIGANIIGCNVFRRKVYTEVIQYPNLLCNDVWAGSKLRRMGYHGKRPSFVVGTHFDNPDDFQVFRRFFIRGVKDGKRFMWNLLEERLSSTMDSRYELAMRSVEFGMKIGKYPTSHNLEYDREMYEAFRNGNS
jgi:glycosyltransferase involved in cell wall biosynthesis